MSEPINIATEASTVTEHTPAEAPTGQVVRNSALIIVDVQPDFMPGGALACAEGGAILPELAQLLAADRFAHVVATQDWHPPGHISFASTHHKVPFEALELYGHHQTLWPDHCIQNSEGAALHPSLDWRRVDAIIRKGTDARIDSYSAFRNNIGPDGQRPSTGLAGWLHERGVESVYICGLARDVCVLWTAEDAAAAGFRTHVLWSLTRPVTFDTDEATRSTLERLGIAIVDTASL
ncbi:bifunctional nicotinamidase/pyrazinamidase [Phytohalomonas tamaricis]|uniref:bifunctional nicotinamidase/pyrazinamidase n=1 Tax=Phytohalomonas tamaricis TaxID=2081032 RepID=UPI0021D425E9|nr:bifunctional nicotinamidase/pyrazinamidase [Phytohalomonas tamaricis]